MTLIILVTSMLTSNQQYYSIQNENKWATPQILQLGLHSPILPEQNRRIRIRIENHIVQRVHL